MKFKSTKVTLHVKSIDDTVRFYTEKLGFKIKHRHEDHWAELEGPQITFGVHPIKSDESYERPSNNPCIGFYVDDMKSARAALKDKGIECDEPKEDGPVLLSFFQDPDGVSLYLCQYT